jgi:hypothetical protein
MRGSTTAHLRHVGQLAYFKCVKFVLDLKPRFSLRSHLTSMYADYWAFRSGEPETGSNLSHR